MLIGESAKGLLAMFNPVCQRLEHAVPFVLDVLGAHKLRDEIDQFLTKAEPDIEKVATVAGEVVQFAPLVPGVGTELEAGAALIEGAADEAEKVAEVVDGKPPIQS